MHLNYLLLFFLSISILLVCRERKRGDLVQLVVVYYLEHNNLALSFRFVFFLKNLFFFKKLNNLFNVDFLCSFVNRLWSVGYYSRRMVSLMFIINEIVTQNKTKKQKNNIWRLFVVDLLMRTFFYLALAWLYLIINLLKLFSFPKSRPRPLST